jgi:hypothetical protein
MAVPLLSRLALGWRDLPRAARLAMDFDSALASLGSASGRPPTAALRAAAEHAGELVAAVSAVMDLGARGELLTREEENLASSGLCVLAEGRRSEVLPTLCRFLRASPETVEGLFDGDFTHPNGILYSLWRDDAAPLFELGSDVQAQDDARAAAISALGRLVAESRADRDRFVQLLDRFDFSVAEASGDEASTGGIAVSPGGTMDRAAPASE